MATIEERAETYGRRHRCGYDLMDFTPYIEEAYEDGATEEHELLTRWRDPKKELPEEGVPVLVKSQNGTYAVLLRYNHQRFGRGWTPDNIGILTDDSQIIGWRPIEENQ